MATHATTKYALDVCAGKVLTCKWERLACDRHLKDLEKSRGKSYPWVFDVSRADRIFKWFEICKHVRGPFAGQSIILEAWQRFDLGCVFGWVDRKTGRRRFKTAYIRVARGNTKSTMMSGVANYGMCADAFYPPCKPKESTYEAKPEVVCGAVDKFQAEIVWGDAREMALASPEIAKRLTIQKNKISHAKRGGGLKKLSKDSKNKDGGAPCIIIIDEYHAHPTSLIKDVTSSGKGKRSQCLEFIITTAGEDSENKPCKIEDGIVKKILEGEFPNDNYFGMIREIDDEDDPHDETKWTKANPLFQTKNEYSKTLHDQIKDEHDLAFGSGDNSKIRQWMIKRVNRWQVESAEKYMSGCMDKWKSLAKSRSEFEDIVSGKECYAGVDLSKCVDLTASGYVFVLENGRFAVCAHGFMPENTATKHEHGDRVPYKDWAKDGWCSMTDGDVTDDRFVKEHIKARESEKGWNVKEICYDPYGARQFANDMTQDGYTCVETRQGVQTLSEPTKKFRELVLQGLIVHDGSPLLTWCVSNAVEVSDNNGNIKLSKKHKDDSQRIDLLAAIINAMTRAMINEQKTGGRVFFA